MGIWIVDTEWDSLKGEKLHVIVARNADNPSEYRVFEGDSLASFTDFSAKHCSIIVGHNYLGFDLDHVNNYFRNLNFPYARVIDTLVCSRLFNFHFKGGHSVENYADRFSARDLSTENPYGMVYPKDLHKVKILDWSVYTPEIRERCITDTLIQWFIWNYQKKWIYLPEFQQALRTEHFLATFCQELSTNGFPFAAEEAKKLRSELDDRLSILDQDLLDAFPPKRVLVYAINPRATKSGAIHAVDFRRLLSAGYSAGDVEVGKSYDIYETQVFNPGSLKQVIERLWDAGWKPTDRTKGHAEFLKENGVRISRATQELRERAGRFAFYGWRLSEENLRTLPDTAPEAALKLVERLLVASRVSDLDEWLGLVQAGKIHGKFFHIGSWTQRMSTSEPNMQNIPVPQHKDNPSDLDKLSDDINAKMRSLWTPEVQGNVLVGTDADGIQMRVFAHYVNDPRLTEALTKGSKSNGTDIHTVHWKALGEYCKGRNPAKTFIYAWLLGAGTGKVSEILECSFNGAKDSVSNFIAFYPGLKELKEGRIPQDAARGYFKGLDNRLVICDNTHLMLAGYLQNGEKVIMATALPIWRSKLIKEGIFHIPRDFVHDEWQTETRPDLADIVGRTQADAIREAGEILGLNCPLAGQYKIGLNWNQTH